jgi:hypothetical protein
MKNLTKFVISLILLLGFTASFGQRFGVKAGLNMAKISFSEDAEDFFDDIKYAPKFHVGLSYEYPFSDMFAVETGVLLSAKGFRVSGKETDDGMEYKYSGGMNVFNAEIPINAKVYFPIGDDLNAYVSAGPYVGAGLMGNTKFKFTVDGETESDSEKLVFGNDDESDIKRLDYGVNIGAGIAREKLQAGAFFGLGLANIIPGGDADNKGTNQIIGLSLTYFLK